MESGRGDAARPGRSRRTAGDGRGRGGSAGKRGAASRRPASDASRKDAFKEGAAQKDAPKKVAASAAVATGSTRLQKVLAQAGVASRRGAEELISAGRVRVAGQVVTTLGLRVDPARDVIEVDGRRVSAEPLA